jgi:P-type conjugative transfer protein TrbG
VGKAFPCGRAKVSADPFCGEAPATPPRPVFCTHRWAYPQDQLIALHGRNVAADSAAPVAAGIDLDALRFRYRIEGDSPAWRPLRAFDDGRQVFIEFPAGIGQGEMPPLWVIGAEGGAELVNYRVQGRHMIVDRLFAAAELRLGGEHQQKVRIVRTDARPQS